MRDCLQSLRSPMSGWPENILRVRAVVLGLGKLGCCHELLDVPATSCVRVEIKILGGVLKVVGGEHRCSQGGTTQCQHEGLRHAQSKCCRTRNQSRVSPAWRKTRYVWHARTTSRNVERLTDFSTVLVSVPSLTRMHKSTILLPKSSTRNMRCQHRWSHASPKSVSAAGLDITPSGPCAGTSDVISACSCSVKARQTSPAAAKPKQFTNGSDVKVSAKDGFIVSRHGDQSEERGYGGKNLSRSHRWRDSASASRDWRSVA